MSVFRFKQFEVKQSDSAMKVGTDSVLLGCLAEQAGTSAILDIGTGTGLLCLMMTQRFPHAIIDAVEIDASAYEEAKLNAEQSPWNDRITIHHQSFQDFENAAAKKYDLIISNPPYYKASGNIKIADVSRSNARHDGELPFEALLKGCSSLLQNEGSCWFVLPIQEAEWLVAACSTCGLYLNQRISIFPKRSKEANRVVLALGKTQQPLIEKRITIYNEDGSYTQEYFELTQEFLLWEKGL
jgi:tRNA1Val (adenine37-N6)-methyltransferase